MGKKLLIRLLILIVVPSFGSGLFAQGHKVELGVNVGAYVYQGDLTPEKLGSFKTMKPGIGLSFAKPLSSLFSVRGIFNFASLKGNEAKYDEPPYRQKRAFAFTTPMKEIGVQLQFNFLGKRDYWPVIEPYAFAGISAAFINTRKDFSGFDELFFSEAESTQIVAGLEADNARRNRRTVLNLPVGAGLRYNVNKNWALATESNFRLGGSDYIDGFSLAVNPAKKDHFFSQNFGVTYRMGSSNSTSKVGCPTVN